MNQVNIEDQVKPDLVIFSSGKQVRIAEAIRDNLKRWFTVKLWTEGFFVSNEVELNTFLKKLLGFDVAVLVLGDDNLRVDQEHSDGKRWVPRDAVIFELGACMSRLGPKKTFFVCPESPEVALPSYFKAFTPLTYERRTDDDLQSAVGSACVAIRNQFENLDQNAYYPDLPAQGLAIGYFYNFVYPTYDRLNSGEGLDKDQVDFAWVKKNGFELNIVMPVGEFMNRDQVGKVLGGKGMHSPKVRLDDMTEPVEVEAKEFKSLQLRLNNGRDINIYFKPRLSADEPLILFDIPTTLLTSSEVIRKVDAFWGGGDSAFRKVLERRQIPSFRRALADILEEKKIGPDVQIRSIKDLFRSS